LRLGLRDLLLAWADLQFFQLGLRTRRISLSCGELRVSPRRVQLHQHGPGLDLLSLAHLHRGDDFGRRRRHRDPVPFQRAQCSRR